MKREEAGMTRTIALLSLLSLAAVAETVEIRSAADWDNFATRVNNGEATLNAVLMRDVTLTGNSPRCGFPETRRFRGEFDGNGKTLTAPPILPRRSHTFRTVAASMICTRPERSKPTASSRLASSESRYSWTTA